MTNITAGSAGIVIELCYKDGEMVAQYEIVANLEMMKLMFPVVTPEGGRITYKVKEGDYVDSDAVIGTIE